MIKIFEMYRIEIYSYLNDLFSNFILIDKHIDMKFQIYSNWTWLETHSSEIIILFPKISFVH